MLIDIDNDIKQQIIDTNKQQTLLVYQTLPGTLNEITKETCIKKERVKHILNTLVKNRCIYKKHVNRGTAYYPYINEI